MSLTGPGRRLRRIQGHKEHLSDCGRNWLGKTPSSIFYECQKVCFSQESRARKGQWLCAQCVGTYVTKKKAGVVAGAKEPTPAVVKSW